MEKRLLSSSLIEQKNQDENLEFPYPSVAE
jgi:hypothetical protein